MNRFRSFVKEEMTGWKRREVIWLFTASLVILLLSLYWRDTAIGIVSALTGVWCVIFTGQGKRSSFLFGMVNVLLYAWISYGAGYYGEVMLNMLYYVPMNFVGWILWTRHLNAETGEVEKTRMKLSSSLIMYLIVAAAIYAYGLVLRRLGGNLPFIDSMSTVVSVAAQILSVRRLTEQWILWIVVDVVTVIMWAVNFAAGGESIATLLMWIIYLLNAVFMYVRWKKEASA